MKTAIGIAHQKDVLEAAKILNNAKPKIEESLFKSKYLPLLHGDYKVDKDEDYPLFAWMEIAGSPYTEVDVVGSDGNVVATVPPLANNLYFIMMEDSRFSVNEIMGEAVNKNNMIPNSGEKLILDSVARRIINKEFSKNLFEMNKLFEVFNLSPLAIPNEESSENNTATNNVVNNDISFEEWDDL